MADDEHWLTLKEASEKLRISDDSLYKLFLTGELKLTWNTDNADDDFVWLYSLDRVGEEPIDTLRSGLFEIVNSKKWDYVFERLLKRIDPSRRVFFDSLRFNDDDNHPDNLLVVREIDSGDLYGIEHPASFTGYHPIELPTLDELGVMTSEVDRYKANKVFTPKQRNLGLRQMETIKVIMSELGLTVKANESQTGVKGNSYKVFTFIKENLKTRPEFNIFSLGGDGNFREQSFRTSWKKYIREVRSNS